MELNSLEENKAVESGRECCYYKKHSQGMADEVTGEVVSCVVIRGNCSGQSEWLEQCSVMGATWWV